MVCTSDNPPSPVGLLGRLVTDEQGCEFLITKLSSHRDGPIWRSHAVLHSNIWVAPFESLGRIVVVFHGWRIVSYEAAAIIMGYHDFTLLA
jgi:hypothetical protein